MNMDDYGDEPPCQVSFQEGMYFELTKPPHSEKGYVPTTWVVVDLRSFQIHDMKTPSCSS